MIKPLPINRLREILAKEKEFQRLFFQLHRVERICVKQSGLSHWREWQEKYYFIESIEKNN